MSPDVRRSLLDHDEDPEVRRALGLLTVGRLTSNSGYRFAPPFLAVIAGDLDVSLATLGAVVAVSELAGLAAPAIGRLADRLDRRHALIGGLLGVAAGSALAGAAPHPVVLAVALFALGWCKILFDAALLGWLADRVPYERRARVIALNETSWALSMLVGVPVMGLVTAAASWRWGFAIGALAMVLLAMMIARRVLPDPHRAARHRDAGRQESTGRAALTRSGWGLVASLGAMMAAVQAVTVTFGSWLEERHGLGVVALAGVTLGLGVVELSGALSVARVTDRWGKRRSVLVGTAVMIPAAALLAVGGDVLLLGMIALLAFIAGFEFAMVASVSLSTQLVPGQPAAGFGLMIGAGTLGRVAASYVATVLYEQAGMWLPAIVASALVAVTTIGVARSRAVTEVVPQPR